MSNHLFLDAAYPPSPAELLADMAQTGADGCFLYVWGPIVNWTPYHKVILEQAGKLTLPIVVPGNSPGDPNQMGAAVDAWGWHNGTVLFDFEQGSDPGKPWFDIAANLFAAHGYRAEPYGTPYFLDRYDPTDKDWVATWIRTGVLDPLPQLPAGWEAWQFVNDILINGHQYDASIVSDQLIKGDLQDMTRDDWAAFYGALIVLVLRDPPLLDVNQPDGEDYFWADHTLQVGPRQAMREFLNDMKQQAAVKIPLQPTLAPNQADLTNLQTQVNRHNTALQNIGRDAVAGGATGA